MKRLAIWLAAGAGALCLLATGAQAASLDRHEADLQRLERSRDWPGLERLARAALSSLPAGASRLDVAEAASWLGEALDEQGRPAEAEPLFRRALGLRRRALGPDAAETAVSAGQLAGSLRAQGRYAEAEPLLREALAADEKSLGPEQAATATAADNLAALLQTRGAYEEAEALHRRALAIFETTLGPEQPDTATALDNLATLLQSEGRYREAEPLFRRALAIDEKVLGPEHPEVAIVANNLAGLLQAQGRPTEAESLLRRALAIDEATLGQDHPDAATGADNLAMALRAQGRYAEAEPLERRALAVFERTLGPEHPSTATAIDHLARLLQDEGEYAAAAPLLGRVLAIRRKTLGDDHPDTAESFESLGLNQQRLSRFGEAAASYRLACSARFKSALSSGSGATERVGDAARAARTRASDCSTNLTLSLWGWARQGGGPAAKDHPDALRQEAFLSAQRAIQSAAGEALARSAALTAAQAAGVGDQALAYEDALVERQGLDHAFSLAAAEGGAGGVETRAALAKARLAVLTRIATLSAALKDRAPLYWLYRSRDPVTVAALQAKIGPDAVLLHDNETLILLVAPPGEDVGLVFAVGKASVAWASTGLTGDVLRARVGALRRQIEARRRAFDRQAAYDLYRALLGDPAIQAVIGDRPVLLVVPSGPLTSLPPGLLVTAPPEGGVAGDADQARLRATSWLLRTKAPALLPAVTSLRTLRQLIPTHRITAPDPMLAFADPDFRGPDVGGKAPAEAIDPKPDDTDPSAGSLSAPSGTEGSGPSMAESLRRLPRLPGTRIEGEALEAALGGQPGSLLLGADASKAQLMARNADGRLARVRVLEFATHGLVAGAAEWLTQPALALAAGPKPEDELLLASDASSLHLNADWVLLSACDTASPDAPEAEGLSGLSRAFFYAGARSLLVSHWPVRDDIAARLIPATLVAARDTPGLSRAEALREATLAILDDPKLRAANPIAWAPFTLVGEAGP